MFTICSGGNLSPLQGSSRHLDGFQKFLSKNKCSCAGLFSYFRILQKTVFHWFIFSPSNIISFIQADVSMPYGAKMKIKNETLKLH